MTEFSWKVVDLFPVQPWLEEERCLGNSHHPASQKRKVYWAPGDLRQAAGQAIPSLPERHLGHTYASKRILADLIQISVGSCIIHSNSICRELAHRCSFSARKPTVTLRSPLSGVLPRESSLRSWF